MYVPYVACVALDGNPAFVGRWIDDSLDGGRYSGYPIVCRHDMTGSDAWRAQRPSYRTTRCPSRLTTLRALDQPLSRSATTLQCQQSQPVDICGPLTSVIWPHRRQGHSDGGILVYIPPTGVYRYIYTPKSVYLKFLCGCFDSLQWLVNIYIHPNQIPGYASDRGRELSTSVLEASQLLVHQRGIVCRRNWTRHHITSRM